jgi:hypothetical protein
MQRGTAVVVQATLQERKGLRVQLRVGRQVERQRQQMGQRTWQPWWRMRRREMSHLLAQQPC